MILLNRVSFILENMMTNKVNPFRENPWEGIDSSDSHRRLFEKDDRFWVSINSQKQLELS